MPAAAIAAEGFFSTARRIASSKVTRSAGTGVCAAFIAWLKPCATSDRDPDAMIAGLKPTISDKATAQSRSLGKWCSPSGQWRSPLDQWRSPLGQWRSPLGLRITDRAEVLRATTLPPHAFDD